MKKALYVATVVKTHINSFHIPFLKLLKEMGYTTYVAAKNDYGDEPCVIPYCDHFIDIPFDRSPVGRDNLKAYGMLRDLIEKENFRLVHCHTPVAAILTRLAAAKARRKQGTKVFYTAHGFHFFKGAPLQNWLLFYPAEWLCARMTDVLLTINAEDYALAKRRMHAKRVELLPGIGVDLSRFGSASLSREEVRMNLGIDADAAVVVTVGELIPRKNHQLLIRAMADLDKVQLLIAGDGVLRTQLQELIDQLGVQNRVKLLGFRRDIPDLLAAADAFVFPSLQEGLPVAVMEAMAHGLPTACTPIRGNTDLVDRCNGAFFSPEDVSGCQNAIYHCLQMDRDHVRSCCQERIAGYDLSKVLAQMEVLYIQELEN